MTSARTLLAAGLLALAPAAGALAQAPGAARPGAPPQMTIRRDTSLAGIDTTGGKVQYRREVYHYTGGSRDPFQTLITSSGVRPTINDLKLVSIIYDPVYGRSVAVVREMPGTRIHRLRRGDTLGRLRVLQIREYEVVFQLEEFGFERQVVLALQKPGEENP